jgi:CubicO group peptidase (beta-lactamase class C family)
MKKFSFLVILTVLYTISKAQQLNDAIPDKNLLQKLEPYLLSANKAYRFNGSVLIAQKGMILLHKSYGWKNVENKTLNDTSTCFPILSMTKSFTATVILKLQEEGKLSVGDRLAKFFPDYPQGDKITIENLLTHTSGIHNYTDDVGVEDSAIICYPIPKQRLLDLLYAKPPEFTPGKRFSYNNSGYFLLGMIIEKVTGEPYEQVVRDEIFNPLEMTNSGFDFIHLPETKRAQGYDTLDAVKQTPYRHFDSTYTYSAGAIYSTTGDLYKWAKAIASGKILSAESWKMAFTPRINEYGYGWKIGTLFGKNYVRHDGGYPGFMSDFIYYPREDITIILLNNFGTYGQNVWAVAMGISSILFNMPYDNWQLRMPVETADTILKRYVGVYALNNNYKIRIFLKDGQLFGVGMGKSPFPELPLLSERENQFYLRDFNTTLAFVEDNESHMLKLVIHEHGKDSHWKKIKE